MSDYSLSNLGALRGKETTKKSSETDSLIKEEAFWNQFTFIKEVSTEKTV